MKVVVAIDSFKGSLSSLEAGEAAAAGVRRAIPGAECVVRPLADGGEGTVEALVGGMGGEFRDVAVTGPAGRTVTARYGLLPGGVCLRSSWVCIIYLRFRRRIRPRIGLLSG